MRYEFIVQGSVCDEVLAELAELTATPFPTGGTALFGAVQDYAEITGLLVRITSLGLRVVEVRPLPD